MDEPGSESGRPWSVHGTAVALGETGILIRGPSGSGKSSLARALVEGGEERRGGRETWLVADDRVRLSIRHGRVIARPHPRIAGAIEQRGEGLLAVSSEPAAVLRCVVDLAETGDRDNLPRLPDPSELVAALGAVQLPRLVLPQRLSPLEAGWRVRTFVNRMSS